jgi:signal peptidase II
VPNDAADPTRPGLAARGWLVAGIVVAVVALDQATKAWAVSTLPGHPDSIIGDTLQLELTRNRGSAFSLFQTVTPLLAALALVVAVFLVRAVRRTDDRVMLVALALVLGGALGNVADRLFRSPGWFRGAVVDFISVRRFPTFNVADSAITVGAVLLVLWSIVGGRSRAAT